MLKTCFLWLVPIKASFVGTQHLPLVLDFLAVLNYPLRYSNHSSFTDCVPGENLARIKRDPRFSLLLGFIPAEVMFKEHI